jgi:hypothetical protein
MKNMNKDIAQELVSYFADTIKDEYLDMVDEGESTSVIKDNLVESLWVGMPDYEGESEVVIANLTTEYDDSDEAIDKIVKIWKDPELREEIYKNVKAL